MTVTLMIGGDRARWLALDVGLLKSPSVETSWVRNPSGGFRMLGKFVYHTLPKVSRDASSMSEKDRSRSLNQRRKDVTSKRSQDRVL